MIQSASICLDLMPFNLLTTHIFIIEHLGILHFWEVMMEDLWWQLILLIEHYLIILWLTREQVHLSCFKFYKTDQWNCVEVTRLLAFPQQNDPFFYDWQIQWWFYFIEGVYHESVLPCIVTEVYLLFLFWLHESI